ncbi:MAG: Ig-like domain-containing protein, partial [Gammaproteobacteria bacterium]
MSIIISSLASGLLSSRRILRTRILLSLFMFAPTLASAATYYVAPSGSNSSSGTQAQPFATLQKAHDVATAGDTIYMRGGIYNISSPQTLTKSGSNGNPIKVFAYSGERPVLDAITQPSGSYTTAIIRMTAASWWHIKGLELKNGSINGIFAGGNSSNNIIENNNIHHIGRLAGSGGGVGTAIYFYCVSAGCNVANNTILNNDLHDNDNKLDNDASAPGGDANGIGWVALGTGNVIRGNRAWRNSDDGIDMWNATPALIENNWVWENGFTFTGGNLQPRGNGNGFKLGGNALNDGGHTLKNNVSWKNRTPGFSSNSADLPMTLYNNTSWLNGNPNFSIGAPLAGGGHVLKNNLAFGPTGVSIAGGSTASNNSWQLPVTVSNADFASLDDTCARGPRQADGSLPNCTFLHLATGSDLINQGANVGIPSNGTAPDLGAFEYSGTSPDSTPPTVSITAPANGATVSGTAVTVSANASDNVSVAGVQFKLDGVDLGAEDTTSPYSLTWNTTATNGTHTLSAVARDA